VFPELDGLRLHAGPTQSGGASQMWFCAAAGISVDRLTDLLAAPRGHTPLFLPQLAGERAPLWDASLRGAFLGLTSSMGTADLGRAVLEGVAFSARHVLGALESSAVVVGDTVKCGGGGFRSGPWGQIRADVLGKRLLRLAVNDPVVVGAAALAAYGAGAHPTLAAAHASFARYDHAWEPNPANRALYDDLYGIYRDAIAANAALSLRLTHAG